MHFKYKRMKLPKRQILILFAIIAIHASLTSEVFSQNLTGVYMSDSLSRPESIYDSGDLDFDLILAAEAGDESKVIDFINQGADVNTQTLDGVTPLMYAAEKGYYSICRILILHGANIDRQPGIGPPALIGAVKANKVSLVELLIQNGGNINISDRHGATSLHYAAAYQLNDIIDLLLFYGADINLKDDDGSSALLAAAWSGNLDGVKLLHKKGAVLDEQDKLGYSALFVAAQENHKNVVEYILGKNAIIDQTTNENWTPLAAAIVRENNDLVKFLIQNGADVNYRISYSENPLSLAHLTKNSALIDLLKKNGAKGLWQPYFSGIAPGIIMFGNTHDFYLGTSIQFIEWKYRTAVDLSWAIRPFYSRVLTKESENLYYQYWENRNTFSLGIKKEFPIIQFSRFSELDIALGVKEHYTFGKYRGTERKPNNTLITGFEMDFLWKHKYMLTGFTVQYIDYNIEDFSPIMVGFKWNYIFGIAERKDKLKKFKWY